MHFIIGLVLLVVVAGAGLFALRSGVLEPLVDPFASTLGVKTSTSTVPANQSPYYGQVEIHFLSLGSGLSQPMVLTLKGNNSSENEGITLTGWNLRTNKGTYSIPKVANLYSPSVAGVPPEDIYLRSGGTVAFYSGKNPQGNQQAIRSGLAEWQVWLGEDFLSAPHGTVTLRDAKRKLVDEYKY